MLKQLPNLMTLGNLFCGCLGVVWALDGNLHYASYLMWLAAVLDFGDGFVARWVKASSEFGKQLDSLADLVSFGLLPSLIIFQLFGQFHPSSPWLYLSFLITLCSALRLARFNIDPEQSHDFKGLPTPASGLLISSFPFIFSQNEAFLRPGLDSLVVWILLITLLSYLLVSNLRLFGLKFSNFSWADNKYRFILVVLSVIVLAIWKLLAVPVVVLLYVILSVLQQYRKS
jgi:CDP-diacylglycerol--serine O-phosphatidyltransferase